MRLEQFDLGSGRKLGRMEMPFGLFTSVHDFSSKASNCLPKRSNWRSSRCV
jgi:hypothetical protein